MTDFAVVICDMWDAHHCVSAARRVAELAPRMNSVVGQLRARGGLVIHSPADCMDFYAASPARQRALDAPFTPAPVPFDWNSWDWEREGPLPVSLTEPGPCSCDTVDPCNDGQPPFPWTRQVASIEIAPADAVSDDGQVIWNLLQARRITDVVLMGVHANVCVLSRWYGIRQFVYLGLRPVLCGDLTDAFHRDPRGHEWGTHEMLHHIQRYWCPVKSSADVLLSLT
jgi:nicotinamidase-related amidase